MNRPGRTDGSQSEEGEWRVLTSGEMFLAVVLIALSGLISFQCEFEIAQIARIASGSDGKRSSGGASC